MNELKITCPFIKKEGDPEIQRGRACSNRVEPVPAPERAKHLSQDTAWTRRRILFTFLPQLKNGHSSLFTHPFSTDCHPTAGLVSRETLSETWQIENQKVPRTEEGRVEYSGHATALRTLTYLVWRKGMGRDTHRKGSKVLLCFRQWGQVKEDLWGRRTETTLHHTEEEKDRCSAHNLYVNVPCSLVHKSQRGIN